MTNNYRPPLFFWRTCVHYQVYSRIHIKGDCINPIKGHYRMDWSRLFHLDLRRGFQWGIGRYTSLRLNQINKKKSEAIKGFIFTVPLLPFMVGIRYLPKWYPPGGTHWLQFPYMNGRRIAGCLLPNGTRTCLLPFSARDRKWMAVSRSLTTAGSFLAFIPRKLPLYILELDGHACAHLPPDLMVSGELFWNTWWLLHAGTH